MNFNKLFTLLLLTYSLSIGCENSTVSNSTEKTQEVNKKTTPSNPYVASIEEAHKTAQLLENDAISFDLELTFGEKKNFVGTILTKTNSSKIKMTRKEDGATLVFDGNNLYLYPDTATWKNARFAIFTYQYFFMAPYKLSDKGTKWEDTGEMSINNTPYDSQKLSFEAGTGDAPDDWYWIYKNKKTNQIDGMAYIVTAGGRSLEEAEKNASAIYYEDYQTTFGFPIASKWEFYKWSKEEDFYGEMRGYAYVRNIRLFEEEKDLFLVPEGAKLVE